MLVPKLLQTMENSLLRKLAMVLYYLKDTGSLWMTTNALGVHQCTVSKILATYQITAKFSRDVRESVRT